MEGLALLTFACCVLVGPVVAIGAIVMGRTILASKSAAVVGEQLGFAPGPRQKSVTWHLGRVNDRDVGLVPVALRMSGVDGPTAVMGLRIVVAVHQPSNAAIVYRPAEAPAGTDSFSDAFRCEHIDLVPSATQEAMLAFVQANPGALRLRSRSGASTELLPPAVLRDATTVLAHEFVRGSDDPSEVSARIHALQRIAQTLESAP